MTRYIYTGEWRSEWRGPDGETSFAADCHKCGPGHELEMFPEEPEIGDGDETVEVWSLDPTVNGTTMILERSSRWKVNVAESYVGLLSPTGGPGGTTDLVDAIPLAEYMARFEGKRP